MNTSSLKIQNVKCDSCIHQFTNTLMKLEGVNKVLFDKKEGVINIDHEDPNVMDHIKIKLKMMGCPAYDSENTLNDKVNAYMSCLAGKLKNL